MEMDDKHIFWFEIWFPSLVDSTVGFLRVLPTGHLSVKQRVLGSDDLRLQIAVFDLQCLFFIHSLNESHNTFKDLLRIFSSFCARKRKLT